MVGKGTNKKSMAYIANFTAFLESCLQIKFDYGLVNYVDTPDMTMNELVTLVRYELKGKHGVGLRVPYSVGLLLGSIADLMSTILRIQLPISSIRVKKFVSPTEFKTSKQEFGGFVPPFSLSEGITNTLQSEFINPHPDRKIFYTE